MKYTLVASTSNPPLGALFLACYSKKTTDITIEWSDKSSLLKINNKVIFTSPLAISQYLVRALTPEFSPQDILSKTEINHWCNFADAKLHSNGNVLKDGVDILEKALASRTFLTGNAITLADLQVFASLYGNASWLEMIQSVNGIDNTLRWYNFISNQSYIKDALAMLPADYKKKNEAQQSDKSESSGNKDVGKFIDLEGAKMGEVVVRFPPEASGYLHIGHAKAALLNQHYQKAFKGKLIMRFDDTNPAKEKADFEKVILEDLKLLNIHPDIFSHTSDHFDLILEFCELLIKEGKAYVDDTTPETMKIERENRTESINRNNSVEKNMKMWKEMNEGSSLGQKCCVRAKIDMNADNGCMRDPAIFRCKIEPHVRTSTKYKAYPTYDFACPIVDSVEGVTHALRTTEYHDRDDQYFWFIDALGLRKPHIWEYSRLNMMYTVLSKRRLTWFVDQNLVEGWDDPRFPTVRGVLRRGMTVEGLQQFIVAQGSSRSVVVMEWDKIWAFNKKVIDPIAKRYTALEKEKIVPVFISQVTENKVEAQLHPKDSSLGMKTILTGPKVMIEEADAEALKLDNNATFINWGNLKIKKINKNKDGKIESIQVDPDLENKDYKKTLKLTWLSDSPKSQQIPCVCVYFDYIMTKAVLGKDEEFKEFVNPVTRVEVSMIGEPDLINVKKSEIIQIQRKGFFICDEPYEASNRYTGRESPMVLFAIPDGSMKKPTYFQSNEEPVNKTKSNNKVTSTKSVHNEQNIALIKDAEDICTQIVEQGNKIRELKSNKAPKEEISGEVAELLKLKANYKAVSGKEWTPDSGKAAPSVKSSVNIEDLDKQITEQGNKIRSLKSNKASKEEITAEVAELLKLKSNYKAVAGKEWKPESNKAAPSVKSSMNVEEINKEITAQGNKIREAKANKIDKKTIDEEVKILLSLKSQYKELSGKDWKPTVDTNKDQDMGKQNVNSTSETTLEPEVLELKNKIDAQGQLLRQLKSESAEKAKVDAEVQKLLALKADYKTKTGVDYSSNTNTRKGKKDKKPNNEQKKEIKKEVKKDENQSGKKVTRLGLEATKEDNMSEWYSQTITKAEMIEYYDVSGCYILRPWSFRLWEIIQEYFDREIKKLGVENCYFPIFVSQNALEREKTHISDFAPEVAWVTKSGDSDLAEPIAVRPTSETVMYPAYAKWIQSHRDLPLKLNQWNNVVRWEFKHPQPFIRTREFLWQEGHTAHADKEGAVKEVYTILDLYEYIYTDILAIPVVKGRKSEKEKFAGGDFTTTVEAYVHASGRAIQGATSHHLGQNFSKMFEIVYEDPKTQQKEYVYQNSWGITTRTIGVMVMVHGDNAGLVLPPNFASIQVVIIPCGITASLSDEDKSKLLDACESMQQKLKNAGVKVKSDTRDNYSPGWKFNHWELKGVPIRIELGPRDLKEGQFVMVRRDNSEKSIAKLENASETVIHGFLNCFQ